MLGAIWRALHMGETLADPVAWKSGAVTVDMLASFLGLLAVIFPYLHVFASPEVAHAIGGAVLALYAVYSAFMRVATTPTLGIDRRDGFDPTSPNLPASDRRAPDPGQVSPVVADRNDASGPGIGRNGEGG